MTWTHKTLKRSTTFYQTCVNNIGKQYKGIDRITKVFINADEKVFAAEWIDINGVPNHIGGIYPDIVRTIEFID